MCLVIIIFFYFSKKNQDYIKDQYPNYKHLKFDKIWVMDKGIEKIVLQSWNNTIGDQSDRLKATLDNPPKWAEKRFNTFLRRCHWLRRC